MKSDWKDKYIYRKEIEGNMYKKYFDAHFHWFDLTDIILMQCNAG